MLILRCIIFIPLGLAILIAAFWGMLRFSAYCISLTYNGPTKMTFPKPTREDIDRNNPYLDRLSKEMALYVGKGKPDEDK